MSRAHRTCQRGCYTSCSTKTAMNLNQANNCCLWHCSWSIGAARFCSATWIWQLQVATSFLVGFCDCGFSWSCGWRRCSAQLTHFLMCLSASLQPISAHNRRKRTMATIQQVCQVPARKWRLIQHSRSLPIMVGPDIAFQTACTGFTYSALQKCNKLWICITWEKAYVQCFVWVHCRSIHKLASHGAAAIVKDAKNAFPAAARREHNWFAAVQLLANHFCQCMRQLRFLVLRRVRQGAEGQHPSSFRVHVICTTGPTLINILNHSQRLAAHEVGVRLFQ